MNKMEYVNLGKTNMKVSKISFGTIPILKGPFDIMTTYYNLTQKEAELLTQYAYENGINLFDTATNFEYSDAEMKLGKSLKNIREDVIISSKSKTYDKESITNAIFNSLKTLDTDYIDIFFIHQVNPINLDKVLNEKNGALKALIDLKQEGYIRYVGVATHHVTVINEVIKNNDIDVIQLPINILESGFFKEVKNKLKEKHIGILGMKIFGGGILSSFINANTLINYALQEGIDSALIGFGTKKHIDDAINSINNNNKLINYEEIEKLISLKLNGNFCNRCQKCLCKNRIEIHKILRYRTHYLLGNKEWAIKQYNRTNIIKNCDKCGNCISLCEKQLSIPKLIEETKKLCNIEGGD